MSEDALDRPELEEALRRARESGRKRLHEAVAKGFLDAYGIPVAVSGIATDPHQAASLAEEIGFPVALKVLSPDIGHKSDVGGVLLNLAAIDDVIEGFGTLRVRIGEERPSARFEGVLVQEMVTDVDYELILGARRDPVFGAALLFGRGGTGVELYEDVAVALPPLTGRLARGLMDETRVSRLLRGYRGIPAADVELLGRHLVRFAELVADYPEILEIDVNPLAVRRKDFIALDARIILDEDALRDPPAPRSHVPLGGHGADA